VIPKADAAFVCQMEQVLDEYAKPYDEHHPVVCLDESPYQMVSEVRQSFTDSKGVVHTDYEYQREGVVDLYMLVEPLDGYREVLVEDNHKSLTYAKVLAHLVEQVYPTAKRITLVEDNASAHKLAALYEVFPPERARNIIERLHVVRTPAHGSWLNIAECELSVLKRQGIAPRVAAKEELEKQVQAWYQQRNEKESKVDWQFTTKQARIKLKRLYPSL
jgi:transposase